MKILLIGHSAEDHIYYKDTLQVKPGGLYYTSTAMLNIKDTADEIFVITTIDEKSYKLFSNTYDQLNTQYSIRGEDVNPVVRLDIYDDRERTERYLRLGKSLNISYDILNSFDGIFINMISGFDITVDQLKEIRRNFNKTIYMDVHTLTRGVGENLERPQTIIKNFSEWGSNLDFIQVNQTEVFSLYDSNDEQDIAKRVLYEGGKCLIVTKDEKGAVIYFLENNNLVSESFPALKVNVKNKVGCGDIFGAVFFYTFLKFGDKIKALGSANTAAGLVASYDNFDDIGKLKDDIFPRHN
jgi:sugar/nucleoside kinase (ribokinase family)